jgi:hypothetical protein
MARGGQQAPFLRVVRLALMMLGVETSEAVVSMPPPRPPQGRKKVQDHWGLVVERRKAGVGMRRIAAELGVHVSAVSAELKAREQQEQQELQGVAA